MVEVSVTVGEPRVKNYSKTDSRASKILSIHTRNVSLVRRGRLMVKSYCAKFDVFYDLDSGEYLEKNKCSDEECEYCVNRPERLKDACEKCLFVLEDGKMCEGLK